MKPLHLMPSRQFTSDGLVQSYQSCRNVISELHEHVHEIAGIVARTQQKKGFNVSTNQSAIIYPKNRGSSTFSVDNSSLFSYADIRRRIPQAAVRAFISIDRGEIGTSSMHVVTLAKRPVIQMVDVGRSDDREIEDVTYVYKLFVVNPPVAPPTFPFNLNLSLERQQYPRAQVFNRRSINSYAQITNEEIKSGGPCYRFGVSSNPREFILNEGLEEWIGNVDIEKTNNNT